jgi:hypothetical protein
MKVGPAMSYKMLLLSKLKHWEPSSGKHSDTAALCAGEALKDDDPEGMEWTHRAFISAIYADAPARQKLMCSVKGFNAYQVRTELSHSFQARS